MKGLLQIMAVLLLMAMGSCTTTKYVPVVEHKTDTLLCYSSIRDSIYVHDSIHVRERGDTVLVERWHTRWRDRWQHDTLYISKTDSVPKPYPVTEYVERKRSAMEWGLNIIGIVALLGGIVWITKILKRYLP